MWWNEILLTVACGIFRDDCMNSLIAFAGMLGVMLSCGSGILEKMRLSRVRCVTWVDRFVTVPLSSPLSCTNASICDCENSVLAFKSLISAWSSLRMTCLLFMDESRLTSMNVN